ncbi:hypothetical protein L1987_32926 [Smallanthus sonchifolius]|uniref:Uncharacterized protein n=1 Tax=Smallanthus sonchifolius TaxID=185202 RepID=A0ACB9HQY1_9ASTR|nr:hypothetical protein L1987_32926 [Smallanthus sonchifolius]
MLGNTPSATNVVINTMVLVKGSVASGVARWVMLRRIAGVNSNPSNLSATGSYQGVEARNNNYVVTGKFFLNDCFASVLFDTGADRSFISQRLSDLLKETPTLLETKYIIGIADSQVIETTHILKGCKLGLANHKLDINLMPVTLGSFHIIVGMDWLSKNQAEIICRDKIIRLPLPSGETLSVQGEKSGAVVGIISFMKA